MTRLPVLLFLALMLLATPMTSAMANSTDGAMPPMPSDISTVPVIDKWLGRKVSPGWSEEVARAYRRGKCSGTVNYEGSNLLEIDMLFLIAGDGALLKIAPVNAGCPPVEKLVSNRILGGLRRSFPKHGAAGPVWMRSQVRFLWSDAP